MVGNIISLIHFDQFISQKLTQLFSDNRRDSIMFIVIPDFVELISIVILDTFHQELVQNIDNANIHDVLKFKHQKFEDIQKNTFIYFLCEISLYSKQSCYKILLG